MGQRPYRGRRETPFAAAGANPAAKRRGAAFAKGREQPVELRTAHLRTALGRKLANRAANDPPEDVARLITRPEADEVLLCPNRSVPFRARRPVERSLGLREVRRRASNG